MAEEISSLKDASPQVYQLSARASAIDKEVKEHPEIQFFLEKNGNPADIQNASVDTRVEARGQLMIWLMPHNAELFQRVNSYGIHAMQVHYANAWFSKLYATPSSDPLFLSKIRLEAATGEDHSKDVTIPYPDGMKCRALRFVQWLNEQNPQGNWGAFLMPDGKDLRWDRVIMAGASHGSTTAARFAKHQKVARVVMFSGPRDQLEDWQALPSSTPQASYFGFTHVLDEGWGKDHYCRSWEMLGLHQFGPIVKVDQSKPPFENSRRLISDANVGGNPNRAHSASTPGKAAVKDKTGAYLHEAVWHYLFTHPVDVAGVASQQDPDCNHHQR
jgi:hypothetical protein